ncbi:hypothetical protein CLV63_118122 [Murinocardiopsis flavida]|uniref:Uncharacterized protein n=1 Tax=Murinocardiopsis flavida TaxID=645275 RepID=A0A2P8D573_9ACTN|nr:hypothetical protein CLV63_118122 [Murinocardiopsis flavida]
MGNVFTTVGIGPWDIEIGVVGGIILVVVIVVIVIANLK